MPIYEYACKSCGHVFDVLQKMSDDPLVDCPECGAAELRKLVSAPSFRLKGGGWYETDFKTGNRRNVAGGDDAKPAKEGDKKDADKSAAKPDGGGESKAGKAGADSAKPAAKAAGSDG
jgi:putative FmdB family regulatory protein